jgi:hypothetical protein
MWDPERNIIPMGSSCSIRMTYLVHQQILLHTLRIFTALEEPWVLEASACCRQNDYISHLLHIGVH